MPHLVNLVSRYSKSVRLYANRTLSPLRTRVSIGVTSYLPALTIQFTDPLMSECLIYQLKPGRTMARSLIF